MYYSLSNIINIFISIFHLKKKSYVIYKVSTIISTNASTLCLFARLLWEVNAVMSSHTIEGYRKHEEHLISELCLSSALNIIIHSGLVYWVELQHPKKCGCLPFGILSITTFYFHLRHCPYNFFSL